MRNVDARLWPLSRYPDRPALEGRSLFGGRSWPASLRPPRINGAPGLRGWRLPAGWWNQVIQGLPRGRSIALRLDRAFETVEEGMRRRGAKALELSSR